MKKRMTTLILAGLISAASAVPSYEADKKIGKGKFKSRIMYLATDADDTLYALQDDGLIFKFSADGKYEETIDSKLSNTGTIAIAPNGEVYVFSTQTKKEERVSNNKKYMATVYVGVTCNVLDKKGKLIREQKLEALKSAKAARFIGDKLVVADYGARSIIFMDPKTGKTTGEIKKGLRLCCGIFDFCEGPNRTVAVSNLGAFKLQEYNLKGNVVNEFGQRGSGFNDFHGCCNPVSAGYLPDGSIITVEKSPTRIKIYDANGKNAQQIDDIEDLVQGCSYIPVAITSKGNIFLAANSRNGNYLVKCTED